jgi:ABC-type multidrug transport system fused ATPase/permease subunit
MNDTYIDLIEPTPTLKTKKCKTIAFAIRFFLQYVLYIVSFVSWYLYDYFIAGATLLLGFVIVGIIRAKLRNSVIPVSQREYQYSDDAIARWYTAKILCFGEDNAKE